MLFFGVLAAAFARNATASANAAWKAAGEHLGLAHTPGRMLSSPQLNGSVRGVAVRVEVVSRNRSTLTVYSAVHPTPAPPVEFKRQHAVSFLRQIVGGRDVVVGDPRFDDSIVVDAGSEIAITDYLTPARRAAILSIFSTWRTVELTDSWLSVSTTGRAKQATEMVSTINRMVDMVRVLADHEPVDAALSLLDDGELHDAATALHTVNAESDADNVVVQLLEAETLVAAGETVRAVEIVDQVAERLPDDPEVADLQHLVDATTDDDTTAPPASLDSPGVIDDLFASTRYGLDIDRRFSEAYAERVVTWTGTVEQSRGYRSDADFGTEPGTKTTVALGAVGGSRLMSNRVKAVVDLPDGTDLDRGDEITFRGTLLHVDRFTRRLYVRDAVLV